MDDCLGFLLVAAYMSGCELGGVGMLYRVLTGLLDSVSATFLLHAGARSRARRVLSSVSRASEVSSSSTSLGWFLAADSDSVNRVEANDGPGHLKSAVIAEGCPTSRSKMVILWFSWVDGDK